MKNLTLLIVVSLFLAQCYPVDYAQSSEGYTYQSGPPSETPPNAQPGECYAKCMIPPKRIEYTESYYIFTGDSTVANVDVESTRIEIKPERKEWAKRKES